MIRVNNQKENAMKVFAALTVVCSIALLGCATSGTMSSNDADTYIRAANPRFTEALNRGDWNALTGFYADDAVVMMPNADAMRGSAAIRHGFGGMTGMSPNLRG